MFVLEGYPQGGIVFCNLVVFIFYLYIGSLVNLSSGAMSIPIKYPLSIYLACSVKKAGYSSQVLSAFLGTERTSRSIETQKGTRPMSDNVNQTRLDIKGFIMWPRRGRSEVAFAEPEQTREIPSEQDGSTFPAPITNQKTGFAFSCLVADF